MKIRTFALIYGLVFTAVGVAGFFPALLTPHDTEHALTVEQGAGELFGLFPVNLLHNLVHVVFGVWGLAVYRSTGAAVGYARVVAVVYAILTVLGFIPGSSTLFGLVPLHGNDIWLHAVLAAIAGYFGFVWSAEPAAGHTPRHV